MATAAACTASMNHGGPGKAVRLATSFSRNEILKRLFESQQSLMLMTDDRAFNSSEEDIHEAIRYIAEAQVLALAASQGQGGGHRQHNDDDDDDDENQQVGPGPGRRRL